MLLVFIFFIAMLIIRAILSCNIKLNIIINDSGHKIIISALIFEKICIFKTDFYSLLKRIKSRKSRWRLKKKEIFNVIRNLNVRADEINARILIGTSEVQSTAIISGLVNTFIGIIFSSLKIKINKDNFKYKVIPIYSNKNVFHIKIKCIFSFSLVNIINTFIKLKIGDVKHGRRASNRGAYGYCNE